jgi:chromosome segregation ATPase
MEKELKQVSRILQQLRPLLKEFNQKTRGYTEVWTSYPEWATIEKLDKEIRSLFDEVKGVNARCKEFANQFSVIAAMEKVGEVDAPSVLRDARKYMAEFNQKLAALQRDVKVVSNEELWKGLEEGEENMTYQEQIELLKGYTKELKKMAAEVIDHFDRLNEELVGKKKLWVGPGMAAWNAMDAFRARTDRVNAIGKQIAECSKKLQQLKP